MGTKERYRGRLKERYEERERDWTVQIEVKR